MLDTLYVSPALQVVHKALRPEFPAGSPAAFQQLAERCWSADPGQGRAG